MLSAEEREIHIFKTDDEDEFSIYVSSPVYMRKIERQGYKSYKEDTMDGEIVAKYYKIPQKFIKFGKEVMLTDEQRKERSERAKLNLAKNRK
jgi:hypothetical protein